MPSPSSLITRLTADYPEISFRPSNGFRWSDDEQTIFVDASFPDAGAFCLHELSHAILGHRTYDYDVELLKLERDAWEYAQAMLATKYSVAIDEDVAQDNLDTYRQWLHDRSTCPSCRATGFQSGRRQYRCIACGQAWRVNEARVCSLRRYKK